ncbi:DUF4852 domain-containing protein [Acetobacter sp. LMG 32666]|uniref:DUF4852 domain-containing protein n=1 Tax=Acetobacter sp. LMG 32666 TaxID=2959295 RepID=UPI0030C87F65
MARFSGSFLAWRILTHAGMVSLAGLPFVAEQAVAANPAVFAHSRHHNVEIDFADPSSQCAATDLHLTMQVTPQSLEMDTPEQQIKLANALGGKLSTDSQCAAVQSVDVAIMQNGTKTRHLHATRAANWQFSVAAPSDVAPSPTPEPPPAAPAQPEAAQPVAIPEGYMGLLAYLAHQNPTLLDNPAVQACWARHFMGREFNAAYGNEFRMHDVEQQAKTDLAHVSQQMEAGNLLANLTLRLGEYDFAQSSFPIVLSGNVLTVVSQCDMSAAQLPDRVSFNLGENNQTFRVAMTSAQAEQFLKQRTRFGYIDRAVPVSMTFHVAPELLTGLTNASSSPLPAELTNIKIYAAPDKATLLADIGPEALAAMRKAQEAEKAAQLAKEAAQKRAESLRMLAEHVQSANRSEKLAMWVGQGTGNFGLPQLDTIRNVRMRIAMNDQPAQTILLVQADGSGRKQVPTKWPGKLNLTVPEDQPALSSGTWYIVRGLVNVPSTGDFPAADMSVQFIHACTQDECHDAEDPQALLNALQAEMTHKP